MREYAISEDLSNAEYKNFDVVIAGTGLAGIYTALNLDNNISCAIINKSGVRESNSIYAQGGIASVISETDSIESHFNDTLVAGAELNDREAVKVLVKEGPKEITRLVEFGVLFDKDENNNYIVSMEGAHSHNRILHCGGDATGFQISNTLIEKLKERKNITLFNNLALIDVLTDENNNTTGVLLEDNSNKFIIINSPNVVLATGGIGRIYRNSTNSSAATGDGIVAAMRAGAIVQNMEFVQFHPTALIHPDLNRRFFLISEALRGEGAILRNRKWEPFMKDIHPLADLAPRDIVSRAIIREMKKHDLPNVYLDITFKPRELLSKRFPIIYNECMKRGIDIASNWIPVVPVQHYFMGGIKTDLNGKTNINGLFCCGEASCTGVHGANRLASNSLLECLVFGRRCAEAINGTLIRDIKQTVRLPDIKKEEKPLDFETIRSNIRYNMTKKCGIIRDFKGMKEAVTEIEAYYEQLKSRRLSNAFEVETLNMSAASLQILYAAQNRRQSIGAHYIDEVKE